MGALTFTAFGWLRRLLLILRGSKPNHSIGVSFATPVLQWWEAFLVGMTAKMATLVAVYPLIRAKFVLQSYGGTQNVGFFAVLRQLFLQEGFRGLYRGLDAQL